jgi:hypothetical protein
MRFPESAGTIEPMVRLVSMVVGLATAASAAGAGTTAPSLKVSLHPLTVRGTNFGSVEQVTVRATVPPGFVVHRAVADRDGAFVVRFKSVTGSPRGLRVRVFGANGHTAQWPSRLYGQTG